MNKDELFKLLYDKEKWDVWKKFLVIEQSCEDNNELYKYYDDIKNLLLNDKSYIKLRGFILMCKLSKWDIDNKIDKDIELFLNVLGDEKPSIVRMCLSRINGLIENKLELSNIIKNKLIHLDLTKYKDSMSPLIKKDIDVILNSM